MTTPTQAQIEAAAEAIAHLELNAKGKLECVWPRDWGLETEVVSYRKQANAALTAAAQIGEQDDLSERLQYSRGYNIGWEAARNTTIECCVKMVRKFLVAPEANNYIEADRKVLEIIAAIRKLKDETKTSV